MTQGTLTAPSRSALSSATIVEHMHIASTQWTMCRTTLGVRWSTSTYTEASWGGHCPGLCNGMQWESMRGAHVRCKDPGTHPHCCHQQKHHVHLLVITMPSRTRLDTFYAYGWGRKDWWRRRGNSCGGDAWLLYTAMQWAAGQRQCCGCNGQQRGQWAAMAQWAARPQRKRQRYHNGRWQLLRLSAAAIFFFPLIAHVARIQAHDPIVVFWCWTKHQGECMHVKNHNWHYFLRDRHTTFYVYHWVTRGQLYVPPMNYTMFMFVCFCSCVLCNTLVRSYVLYELLGARAYPWILSN